MMIDEHRMLDTTEYWTLNMEIWNFTSVRCTYIQEYRVLRPMCRPQLIITNRFFTRTKAKRGVVGRKEDNEVDSDRGDDEDGEGE